MSENSENINPNNQEETPKKVEATSEEKGEVKAPSDLPKEEVQPKDETKEVATLKTEAKEKAAVEKKVVPAKKEGGSAKPARRVASRRGSKDTPPKEPTFSEHSKKIMAVANAWMEGLEFTEEGTAYLTITCKPDQLRNLAENLRYNQHTQLDFMFAMTGVDYPTYLTVVYHLRSTVLGHTIVLKVNTLDRVNPSVPTLCDIWRTAELNEREVYDLLGVKFENHPDLRRLLLTDDWEGYPLRKDYTDEENIVSY